MKILNKHRGSAIVRVGLCLAIYLSWSRAASAEVELAEKDGWRFTFDGRVDAFLSAGAGDNIPLAPTGAPYTVMGSQSSGPGNGSTRSVGISRTA